MNIAESGHRINYAIVLGGSINPGIFHPDWLLGKGLISNEDYDFVLNHDPKVGNKYSFLKFPDYQLRTDNDSWHLHTGDHTKVDNLFNFTDRVFDMLPETPLESMALNTWIHAKINKENGVAEISKKFLQGTISNILNSDSYEPGIRIHYRSNKGRVAVRIEPSTLIGNDVYIFYGIQFSFAEIVETGPNEFFLSEEFERNIIPNVQIATQMINEIISKLEE